MNLHWVEMDVLDIHEVFDKLVLCVHFSHTTLVIVFCDLTGCCDIWLDILLSSCILAGTNFISRVFFLFFKFDSQTQFEHVFSLLPNLEEYHLAHQIHCSTSYTFDEIIKFRCQRGHIVLELKIIS